MLIRLSDKERAEKPTRYGCCFSLSKNQKRPRQDSNLRFRASEARALSTELRGLHQK